jgi:6-phosphofructokinase 1
MDSPEATASIPATKDLEGVNDTFEALSPEAAAPKPAPPSASAGKRQKKIAVLTSGGDSAGMNAAGTSTIGLA